MYKNQLQELAQRSCFNLPSYACIREGPDHAPRFKASVNFNGEIFESSNYCTTLRQAEHAAAEVALNVLSTRGLSRSLTARVLDETGVYKNLLQETAHRAGLKLPVYTTVRSGPGHVPVFTCTVELAGMNFTGDSAKTKKQAEKNAAIAAWSSLKTMPNLVALSRTIGNSGEEQDKITVAGVVSNFGAKDETKSLRMRRDQNQNQGAKKRPQKRLLDLLVDSSSNSTQKQSNFFSILPPPPPRTTSKILPPTISSSLNNHHHNMQNEDDEKDEEWRNGPKPLYRPIDKAHLKNVPQICRPVYTGGDDDEEWLNGANPLCRPISKAGSQMGRTVYTRDDDEERRNGPNPLYKPISKPNDKAHMKIPSQMGRFAHNGDDDDDEEWLNGPSPLYRPIDKTHMKPGFQMGQAVYTGGYHYPKAFAPAVNIRSIIPVCAAPPLPVRPHTSNPPLVKEDESGLISMFNKVRL